jgi:cytochrome o ubiquinol oxidase operon protein cyoD
MSTELNTHAEPEHGTFKSYVTGFIISVILTVVPFWLVMDHSLGRESLILAISILAVIQIVVQLMFFLHMNSRSEGGWNMIAFLFTVLIILILVIGSLWIMFHLNHNMMS